MKVLFVLPAESIYDQQQRVMGWRQTPAPREKLKRLKELVPRLKELGAQKVVCSDLDAQSGFFLARNLGVPCEDWKSLRRFNFATAHGQSKEKAQKLLDSMQERWKANPDIPVPSGDSWTSFRNRLAASKDKLKRNGQVYVVVADDFVVQTITGIKQEFQRERIYSWEG